MKKARTIATSAVGALTLLTAIPASASSSDPAPAVVDDFEELVSAVPGDNPDVLSIYQILVEEVFPRSPDMWGGAYIDGDSLVVKHLFESETGAAGALESAGIVLVRGLKLEHTTVSLATLNAERDRLSDLELDHLIEIGPQYSESRIVVGVDEGDTEDIDVTASTLSSAEPEVELAFYKSGRAEQDLQVPQTETLQVPQLGHSRWYMPGPIRGGAHLQFSGDSGSVNCSIGFPWVNADDEVVLLSAAHCAHSIGHDDRTNVWRKGLPNAWDLVGTVEWSSGGKYGTVDGRTGDVTLIERGPGEVYGFHGSVWTGLGDTETHRPISGYTTLPENWHTNDLRTSGASGFETPNNTGEISPNRIALVDQIISYSEEDDDGTSYWTGMTVAEHKDDCTSPGDSGGAVYLISADGTAIATGIVSGHSEKDWPSQPNCRNYYTPVSAVVADYGGGPLLGWSPIG